MQTSYPRLIWSQRQRKVKIHFQKIQSLVEIALVSCIEEPRYPHSRLPNIIEITFLNDRMITQVHAQFLQDPTPTDVITFAHSDELGEILIGIPTVALHAQKFQEKVDHEVARCVIHGLLHLLDYDDQTKQEYEIMHSLQETLLKKALTEIKSLIL
ncbi:MAG: rRNA maturation RNase YbeY [Verrucomicrobiae bacterium]|jgi:probable rRNA maturation factor|nr:rRNA maturation RNase YbeY [Verrucomicrobiae bacterium]